jgi:hypothetical protein
MRSRPFADLPAFLAAPGRVAGEYAFAVAIALALTWRWLLAAAVFAGAVWWVWRWTA